MICRKSDFDSKDKTVSALVEGKVVIIPTDTVYGFSGMVNGFHTDDSIRQIKGRSESKALIQLLANPDDILKYTDEKIPAPLFSLWPGALTIIVKDKRFDNKITTAFRCPGDEWLREVIKECGQPIYSTSVNLSGNPVLSTEKEILAVFGDKTDLIVLDGDKKGAKPSTIVSIEDGSIKVIRQGDVFVKI